MASPACSLAALIAQCSATSPLTWQEADTTHHRWFLMTFIPASYLSLFDKCIPPFFFLRLNIVKAKTLRHEMKASELEVFNSLHCALSNPTPLAVVFHYWRDTFSGTLTDFQLRFCYSLGCQVTGSVSVSYSLHLKVTCSSCLPTLSFLNSSAQTKQRRT